MPLPRIRQPLLLRRPLRFALVLTVLVANVACRPQAAPPVSQALETPGFGPHDAPVELLAFVDWECPYSRNDGAILSALATQFPQQLQIRVLHFPLDMHANGLILARGAVAAAQQNAFAAFWTKWLKPDVAASRDALIAWSVEAGLDPKAFLAALDSAGTLSRVARDAAIGHALGVTGTPSFLVNGTLLVGQKTQNELIAAVQKEIDATTILHNAGAEPSKLVHARVAQNAPGLAAAYAKYVEGAEPAPAQPVPVVTQKRAASGVADAQVRSAPLEGNFGGQRALLLPAAPTDSDNTVWRVVVRADDPQFGATDAPVTVVLFLDLFAQESATLLPWLLHLPTPQVRVVVKHLPRPVHPLAQVVAEALEAAREQDRFAALLQKFVDAPQPLTQASILALSTQVGLDAGRFNASLAVHSGKGRVDADIEQAAALGIGGFAALYVNGVRVNALTEATITAAIAQQAEKAAALQKTGVASAAIYKTLTANGKLLDALAPEPHTFDLTHAAMQGLPSAPLEEVVFADFQCPFSARLWPHLRKLDQELPGRLKIAWLDFPQTTVHPLAEQLVEAGQEARNQGKFWPFVEALAKRVDRLDDQTLVQAAKEAGLQEKALKKALTQHQWTNAVQAQRAQGEAAGVKATPTVFLDGHLFQPSNGISADTLRPAIRRLLATH